MVYKHVENCCIRHKYCQGLILKMSFFVCVSFFLSQNIYCMYINVLKIHFMTIPLLSHVRKAHLQKCGSFSPFASGEQSGPTRLSCPRSFVTFIILLLICKCASSYFKTNVVIAQMFLFYYFRIYIIKLTSMQLKYM